MTQQASRLPYEVVDVFTDRPFAGNPLAVVFDADGLATQQLQALANEFNLSETVFVLPPTSPEATYRLRIFTAAHELPFAGHPSVGAAVTQLRRGLIGAGPAVQECGAGLLPVLVDASGAATLTGGSPSVGPALDPEPWLAAAGLTAEDYEGPAPRQAGCGLEFPYLPVREDALGRAVVPPADVARRMSVFSWHADSHHAEVRVFCPGDAVQEDPATGSAALGLGVWLVASGLLPGDGESAYTIRQGVHIGRPSTLECTVTAAGGRAVAATVRGHVVPIASGEIAVPPFIG